MRSGIIFDIKRYAIHDGPGIRTTIFFKGCPLKCQWCHNPEALKKTPEVMTREDGYCNIIGKEMTVKEVMDEIIKDEIFYDESGGGVTFSGGEPMMQYKFLNDILEQCKEQEIHTTVDTSGYCPFQAFETVQDKVNLFLYDLKLMDDTLHKKYTHVPNKLILDNLRKLSEAGNTIIIRIPVIPGVNDGIKDRRAVADFLQPLKNIRRIDLLPYHNWGVEKLKRLNQPGRKMGDFPVNGESVEKLKKYFEKSGFEITVGG